VRRTATPATKRTQQCVTEPRNGYVAGAETVEMVERNMGTTVKRGLPTPGSRPSSRRPHQWAESRRHRLPSASSVVVHSSATTRLACPSASRTLPSTNPETFRVPAFDLRLEKQLKAPLWHRIFARGYLTE
jgi:hypothetical protein